MKNTGSESLDVPYGVSHKDWEKEGSQKRNVRRKNQWGWKKMSLAR